MSVLPETCLVRTLPLKNWALIIRADTDTLSITIARGDSTVSPINTDSPSVKEPRDSRNIRSGTGDSSEEESPIRNIRG